MNTSISIFAEIPEHLHESLQHYLDGHPNWDQDRVFAVALSLFLLRHESPSEEKLSLNYQACAQYYLENLLEYSEP